MTFNTGNPIGSTDARDLSDNAENFDKALGTIAPTWVDRLGVTRDSFEGRLAKGSFYRVGDFTTGYTLTNMRQTLEYSGHEYSWAGTFPKVVAAGATPATSGGIGAGAWVDRSGFALRSDLAATTGAGLVGTTGGDTVQAKLDAIDAVSSILLFTNDIGIANAYVCNFTPAITTRSEGQVLRFKVANTNTGTSTLNDGVGVVPLVDGAHSALQGGELVAGGDAWVQWNSTVGTGSYVLLFCTGASLQIDELWAALGGKNAVAVLSGVIENGGTIPLPSGYTEAQCKWLVSMNADNPTSIGWDINEDGARLHYKTECYTTGRVVTARTYLGSNNNPPGWISSNANYIIIGVK